MLATIESVQTSDSVVYFDLARANLLRMRGQYQESKELCFSILKRYPGNITAHVLLGDVFCEEGDIAQGVQWYEMVLDLEPNSEHVQKKLEEARRTLSDREAADIARQLGLPTSRSRAKTFALLTIAFVVLVSLTFFAIGDRSGASRQRTISTPTTIRDASTTIKDWNVAPIQTTPRTTTENPVSLNPPDSDSSLLHKLSQTCMHGDRLVQVTDDPRHQSLTVTFRSSAGEDPRILAAKIGASILGSSKDYDLVTMRAMNNGHVVLVADVSTEALAKAQQGFRSPPETWSQEALLALLSDSWSPGQDRGVGSPTSGTGGTGGVQTQNSTDSGAATTSATAGTGNSATGADH